jgi:hypothetical protein
MQKFIRWIQYKDEYRPWNTKLNGVTILIVVHGLHEVVNTTRLMVAPGLSDNEEYYFLWTTDDLDVVTGGGHKISGEIFDILLIHSKCGKPLNNTILQLLISTDPIKNQLGVTLWHS